MNTLTLKDNTVAYCFPLYVAGPATFLASYSVLVILFSSENSVFIWISSPQLHGAHLIRLQSVFLAHALLRDVS